jgi:hypothetical protein
MVTRAFQWDGAPTWFAEMVRDVTALGDAPEKVFDRH